MGELGKEYGIRPVCNALNVSKSAYYAYTSGKSYTISEREAHLRNKVKEVFWEHKRRYGSRRIQVELREQGENMSLFLIRRLMREQGLIALQPKQFVPKTTKTHPNLRRSPNILLQREEKCGIYGYTDAPNQVIVGDITYLPSIVDGKEDWLYLAIWMDLFSRKIVGWRVADHMQESIVLDAIKQVIRQEQPSEGLIVHSDGGGQYAAKKFRALLKRQKFVQSMTRKDNHYDNAYAESVFSRFKTELMVDGVFAGLKDAQLQTFEFMQYYNTKRRHSALDYMCPVDFEQRFLEQKVFTD